MRHLLGTGILNWNRSERVSDRYGTLFLATSPMLSPMDSNMGDYIQCSNKELLGKLGSLVAVIKEARPSPHIGDFFRGLCPPTEPLAIGTQLQIGVGALFYEQQGDIPALGLCPQDVRDSDWLDPAILYQLHNQTVDLFFVE